MIGAVPLPQTENAVAHWPSLPDLLEAVRGVCPPFDHPVTVSSRDPFGDTPLHVAAVWGDVEAIEMLVRAGADVDAAGELGCTPLYEAVGQGHAAARRLLDAGASPHLRNEYFGSTPAERALGSRNPELVALFSGLPPEADGGVQPPNEA